jgi:integral membrane sensor domain MASE1
LVAKVSGTDPWVIAEFFTPIWPIWSRVSIVIGALLLVAFSGWWGRHRRRDLARLVKEALTTDSLARPPLPARAIHH